ncbi:MAG TPA: hypothetical protein VJ654_18575 [Noviherbaspirillum sp.]|nr:hypothetical protein [Noviherbaspirillum sp.]
MQKELILSFALAVVVVAGALWLLDGPLSQRMKGYSHETESSSSRQQPKPAFEEARDKVPHQPEIITQESATPGKINKCVLNGKTIYSNAQCPTGAEVKSVELHDSAGIVSPPKEVLSELTAKRKAAELAAERELAAQQRVVRASSSNRDECQWLEKRIEYLDSLARQPQSGHMQDWIKEQKAAARSRQFAIHC